MSEPPTKEDMVLSGWASPDDLDTEPCRLYPPPVLCLWLLDAQTDCWNTGCGESHIFFDGSPRANRYCYCPYCGRELIEGDVT
jgi:hypothetical protein